MTEDAGCRTGTPHTRPSTTDLMRKTSEIATLRHSDVGSRVRSCMLHPSSHPSRSEGEQSGVVPQRCSKADAPLEPKLLPLTEIKPCIPKPSVSVRGGFPCSTVPSPDVGSRVLPWAASAKGSVVQFRSTDLHRPSGNQPDHGGRFQTRPESVAPVGSSASGSPVTIGSSFVKQRRAMFEALGAS